MKLITFLASWFGPYKFYNVNKKTAQALDSYFKENVYNDDRENLLFVMLNKKHAALVPFRPSLHDISGLHYFMHKKDCFVSKCKHLVIKDKSLNNPKHKFNRLNRDAWYGNVLGYPKCCTKRFIKSTKFWLKTRNFDRKLPSTTGFENFLLHAKCKNNCRASKKLAEEYARTIREVCPKLYVHVLGFKYCLEYLREI
jgi:hypothetical protein